MKAPSQCRNTEMFVHFTQYLCIWSEMQEPQSVGGVQVEAEDGLG